MSACAPFIFCKRCASVTALTPKRIEALQVENGFKCIWCGKIVELTKEVMEDILKRKIEMEKSGYGE